MKLTTVVDIRYAPYEVYIGRAGHGFSGYWGNPFRLTDPLLRPEVLAKYRTHFYGRLLVDSEFKRRVLELRGRVLGCFCKPMACHGDVIAEYLNSLPEEKV